MNLFCSPSKSETVVVSIIAASHTKTMTCSVYIVHFFVRCASQCSTLVSWLSSRASYFISRFPVALSYYSMLSKCPFCCHTDLPCSLNFPRSHSSNSQPLSLLRPPVFFAFQRPFLLPQYRIADEYGIISSAPNNVGHCVSASFRHLGICAKSRSSNWQSALYNKLQPPNLHTLPSKAYTIPQADFVTGEQRCLLNSFAVTFNRTGSSSRLATRWVLWHNTHRTIKLYDFISYWIYSRRMAYSNFERLFQETDLRCQPWKISEQFLNTSVSMGGEKKTH